MKQKCKSQNPNEMGNTTKQLKWKKVQPENNENGVVKNRNYNCKETPSNYNSTFKQNCLHVVVFSRGQQQQQKP